MSANVFSGARMKRVVAIAICGLALGACSSMPSWMQMDLPRGAPGPTTLQFESEPAGAEAKTSQGQTCRTPCSMSVAASEFTVTFTHPGYQPQTVPVKVAQANEPADPEFGAPAPRMVPNPVYVELQPAAPPSARRRAPPPKPQPRQATRPAPTTAPAPAPAPAPASPWPPPPSR